MPELTFEVRGAEAVSAAVAPAIALHLEISNSPSSQPIQTVVLNCQIQIDASRRRYGAVEQTQLHDLFGEPERWGETLRPLLWTNLTTTVPGFTGAIGVKLTVPCPFDFSAAATKYFHALEGGTVPIVLLFSGTVFYRTANQLQAAQIPWNAEARFALPAQIWGQAIELHFPNTAWIGLRRDLFDRLYDFKVLNSLATFDEAIERMLERAMKAGA